MLARHPGLLLLGLLLLQGAAGCRERGERAAAPPPALAPQRDRTQEVLSMIPAAPRLAAVVLDWRQLYTLRDALATALAQAQAGQRLVRMAQRASGRLPLPLPWTLQELSDLGVDPGGPAALFDRQGPILAFSLGDAEKFRSAVATPRGQQQRSWLRRTVEELEVEELQGGRRLACLHRPPLVFCGTDAAALVSAYRRRPQRSLWSSQTSSDQQRLSSAAAILASTGRSVSTLLTLQAEPDGVTLRLAATGPPLRRLTALSVSKGRPLLADQARRARGAIYARVDPAQVLGLARGRLPGPGALGIDPIALQAALTGELLLLQEADQADQKVLLVLGSRNPGFSREAVQALARQAGQLDLGEGAARVGPLPGAGDDARLIRARVSAGGKPVDLELALAAGPEGIYIGSPGAVQERTRPPAPDQRPQPPATPAAQPAFSANATLAGRLPLGDPLQALPTVARILRTARLPPGIKQALLLVRLLLDQMQGLTFELLQERDDRVQGVLRLTTLHRDGQPQDDGARSLWLEALGAKYEGNEQKYSALKEKIKKTYPGTRFVTGDAPPPSPLLDLAAGLLVQKVLTQELRPSPEGPPATQSGEQPLSPEARPTQPAPGAQAAPGALAAPGAQPAEGAKLTPRAKPAPQGKNAGPESQAGPGSPAR